MYFQQQSYKLTYSVHRIYAIYLGLYRRFKRQKTISIASSTFRKEQLGAKSLTTTTKLDLDKNNKDRVF